jgi:hypothetical protein
MAVSDNGVIRKVHVNTPVARDAAPLPPNRPRQPLGLAPGVGSSEPIADEPAFVSGLPSVAAGLSAETLARPATMADVAEAVDAAVGIAVDGDGLFLERIGEMRGEVSELKGALIEARHEIRELKLIQESLRISTRGESGRDGARGIPGRDGRDGVGLAGPRGERGERGLPAPRISAWDIDEDRFIATPVFGDGSTGAPLNLLSLFASYDRAVQELEGRDIVSAAADARQAAEDAAEASRWATR